MSMLVAASALGAIWWIDGARLQGETGARTCFGRRQVSSDQVDAAIGQVRFAESEQRRAFLNGSGYAAAKVGLPPGSAALRQAEVAARELASARANLRALCGQAAEP